MTTRRSNIMALIERSSFGEPRARFLRSLTPPSVAAKIAARVESARRSDGGPTYQSPENQPWPFNGYQRPTGHQEIAMSTKKLTNLTPGTTAPRSGQYQQTGPRGGEGREVTVVRGEPLPPTTQPGSTYTLVDPTNNKSGKR